MLYIIMFELMMALIMFFYLNECVNVDVCLKNNETGRELRPNEFWLDIIKVVMSIFWFITIIHIAYQNIKERSRF